MVPPNREARGRRTLKELYLWGKMTLFLDVYLLCSGRQATWEHEVLFCSSLHRYRNTTTLCLLAFVLETFNDQMILKVF
jgi:hypothetical protein